MTSLTSREEERFTVKAPIKGLNTVDDLETMNPLMSSDMNNVDLKENIGVASRKGYTYLNDNPITKYNTGTVSVTNGSDVITGLGTLWLANVTPDPLVPADADYFKLDNSTTQYSIKSVDSNVQITLHTNVTDATQSGQAYRITDQPTFLYEFKNSSYHQLIAFGGNGVMYYMDLSIPYTVGNRDFVGPVSGAIAPSHKGALVQFKDKLYLTDGTSFITWDGASFVAVSGSPSPSAPDFVTTYTIGGQSQYLVIANTDGDIGVTDPDDPTSWPAANTDGIGVQDGKKLTGIGHWGGNLIFFKEDSIHQYSGVPGANSIRLINNAIGCISLNGDGIVEDGSEIYFAGADKGKIGAYKYSGGLRPELMTRSIENKINNADGYVSLSHYQESVHLYIDNRKLIMSGLIFNQELPVLRETTRCDLDKGFVDQYTGQTYWPWFVADYARSCFTIFASTQSGLTTLGPFTGSFPLTFSDESVGKGWAYIENYQNTDKGANIAWHIDTKLYDLGDKTRRKEVLRGYMVTDDNNNEKTTFRLYQDKDTTYSTYSYLASYTVVSGATAQKTDLRIDFPTINTFFKFGWESLGSAVESVITDTEMVFKRENL